MAVDEWILCEWDRSWDRNWEWDWGVECEGAMPRCGECGAFDSWLLRLFVGGRRVETKERTEIGERERGREGAREQGKEGGR